MLRKPASSFPSITPAMMMNARLTAKFTNTVPTA